MIAGADFSTKAVDVVLLDDDTDAATWRRFEIADGRGWMFAARNVRYRSYTRGWWADSPVWMVAMEDPMGRHAHTQKALGGVIGAFMATLPAELTVVPTRPAEWFGLFTGLDRYPRKSADRKAAVAARCAELGFAPGDFNACDAYGVAWAVRKLNADAVARSVAA